MELKDVIHFYLGCEIETSVQGQYVHPYGCVKLTALTPENLSLILYALNKKEKDIAGGFSDSDNIYCKLKLRPLSSMTEEEAISIYTIERDRILHPLSEDFDISVREHGVIITRLDLLNVRLMVGHYGQVYKVIEEGKPTIEPANNQTLIFAYLLKQGFDLFQLIDTNQAIDQNKI